MGVVHKLFAGRRNADLALDFGAETITLLVEDVDAPQRLVAPWRRLPWKATISATR